MLIRPSKPLTAATPQSVAMASPTLRHVRPGLITDWRLGRLAIVYVRHHRLGKSSTIGNRGNVNMGLVDYAVALGWPSGPDPDHRRRPGKSGKTAENRTGFHRLLAEVTMDHVGLILGIEMSRLARSNKDWHHLMEMCAIFGTLLADEDGIYDPRDPNDRLLLGFKGTMSEYEIDHMHNRLEAASFTRPNGAN